MAARAALFLGLAAGKASNAADGQLYYAQSSLRPINVTRHKGLGGGALTSPVKSPLKAAAGGAEAASAETAAHSRLRPSAFSSSTAPAGSAPSPAGDHQHQHQHHHHHHRHHHHRHHDRLTTAATATTSEGEIAVEPTVMPRATLKQLLEDAKGLGRVRLIVNTGMGVLESVSTLDSLFYHTVPQRGEYANVIDPEHNLDFHLRLDAVTSVKLIVGKAKRGDYLTYTLRFIDNVGAVGCSIFVMWQEGMAGVYDAGQVEGFQRMLDTYGEEVFLQAPVR
eukprot:jgi/Chlat1/8882/Chrsp92S08201